MERVTPRKHALIIAIGVYPDPGRYGYYSINADNDIALIQGALQHQGFETIRILQNEQATRQAIIDALDTLARDTNPGDVVVVHYSGHGHQVTDRSGDELDGYDEVIVPYGATNYKGEAARTYDGRDHILDDTLNGYVQRLRKEAGPDGNVVFWLDSCHSGTGTRGHPDGPQRRGVIEPIGAPAPTKEQGQDPEDGGLFEEQTPLARGGGASDIAPFVAISASRQGELNYETRDETQGGKIVGSLSLALSRALANVRQGATYDMLFDEVKTLMAGKVPQQLPQIEGDIHSQVFSGEAVEQAPFYRVQNVRNNGTVLLEGGALTGLFKGTRIAFYPRRTTSPEQANGDALAEGIITAVRPTTSIATLETSGGGIDRDSIAISRAFVTEHTFGDLWVTVQLGGGLDASLRDRFTKLLNNVVIAELVPDNADLFLDTFVSPYYEAAYSSGSFFLMTAADSMPVIPPIPSSLSDSEIKERLLNYARNQYLKGVTLNDDAIDVTLDVIPATHYLDDFGDFERSDTSKSEATKQGGNWVFPAVALDGTGNVIDGYLLRVRNNGTRGAYVTVLDLLPNGDIHQLLPLAGYYSREETLIPYDSTLIFSRLPLAVDPETGCGVEVLKVFATTDPVDFSPILGTRGQSRGEVSTRSGLKFLERLIADVHSGTRSEPAGALRGSAATDAVTIEVACGDQP